MNAKCNASKAKTVLKPAHNKQGFEMLPKCEKCQVNRNQLLKGVFKMKKLLLVFVLMLVSCAALTPPLNKKPDLPVVSRKLIETNPEYYILIWRRDTVNNYVKIPVSKATFDSLKIGDYFNREFK